MTDATALFDIATQAQPGVHRSAVLSQCGTYRYELSRQWSNLPTVGWVMLNPSTADAFTDDPTIRRCTGFAKAWGYGGIVARNLYALRATDPAELARHTDPVGPHNDAYLAECAADALTVVAWGGRGGDRGCDVLTLLERVRVGPYRLGATDDGQPRHPLYLKADRAPVPVPRPGGAGGAR